jgi:rhodanese-related sulfurtransferase
MYLIAIGVAGLCLLAYVIARARRVKAKREIEERSIEPEALHTLLSGKEKVLIFDVRQPLDLLAHSEIIPGATRIAPKEVLENPALIPRDEDSVVYCTCPSDKTSREVMLKARALQFSRIKFLRGGLEAWKAKGYPVAPYKQVFQLDTQV